MALLFIDSFDHYSLTQFTRKWTTSSGASAILAGRTNLGLQINFNGITKTLSADYSTLAMGCAYNTGSLTGGIFTFTNAVTGAEFAVRVANDGRLFLTANLGGGGTSPLTTYYLNTGQWYYVEAKAAISAGSPPTMTTSLRINGTEVLAWVHTAGSGTGGAFRSIAMGSNTTVWTCDDLYVTDGEFLGDVKIGVLYPNAAGDSTAWTPNAGTNWSQVEEHPADDDTSYVSAATVALKDLYNLDNIDPAFTGTIKGVQALWCVRKSDEGDGAIKGLWKSGGTEIVQAAGHNYLAPNGFYPSAVSYLYDIQTERVSLFTAVDWTVAEINALQLGITRTV